MIKYLNLNLFSQGFVHTHTRMHARTYTHTKKFIFHNLSMVLIGDRDCFERVTLWADFLSIFYSCCGANAVSNDHYFGYAQLVYLLEIKKHGRARQTSFTLHNVRSINGIRSYYHECLRFLCSHTHKTTWAISTPLKHVALFSSRPR